MKVTEEMNKEIQEAIKKSLPNQVGEALKLRIEQADKDAETVKEQATCINGHLTTILNLNTTISEYKKLDERNNKLVERENKVADDERNQKLIISELKLEQSEKRNIDIINFTGMVFKSPIYKTHVSESQGGTTQWNNSKNSNEFIPNGLNSKNITKTED